MGKDYQAIVPELNPKYDNYTEKALLVWAPAKDIPDSKLEEYVDLANVRYGYNTEQALGMLFWHKHDLEKALLDLGNFTPFPEEWSKEDKVLFEQAFQFHGKCFHRIRQMVRDQFYLIVCDLVDSPQSILSHMELHSDLDSQIFNLGIYLFLISKLFRVFKII